MTANFGSHADHVARRQIMMSAFSDARSHRLQRGQLTATRVVQDYRAAQPIESMMKRLAPFLLCLSACKFVPQSPEHFIHDAEGAVSYQLADPSSVRFRDERVAKAGGRSVVCGEVNAKTPDGAFGAFTPFAYFLDDHEVVMLSRGAYPGGAGARPDFPAECASTQAGNSGLRYDAGIRGAA